MRAKFRVVDSEPNFPAAGPYTLFSGPGAIQKRSGTSLTAFGFMLHRNWMWKLIKPVYDRLNPNIFEIAGSCFAIRGTHISEHVNLVIDS